MEVIKEKGFYKHLVWQTLSAMVFMYCVLFALDHVAASALIWAAGASCLASSAYCVFGSPHSRVSHPIRLFGGYVIGMISGEALRLVLGAACLGLVTCQPNVPIHLMELAAVTSLGLALVLMVLFRLEHPPAAGLAIVLVLDIRSWAPIIIILIAAMLLTFVRWAFDKRLMNLT